MQCLQISTQSTPIFLGCVGLRPKELRFHLNTSRQPALQDNMASGKLARLVSVATSSHSNDGEILVDDLAEPMNCDRDTFECAVTGVATPLVQQRRTCSCYISAPLCFVSGWRAFSSVFVCKNIFTERDGRKGPPAGNKAECNRTNTPHSKATRHKAKPNQKPQTHTRGERQA
jgi:hypothetical protein